MELRERVMSENVLSELIHTTATVIEEVSHRLSVVREEAALLSSTSHSAFDGVSITYSANPLFVIDQVEPKLDALLVSIVDLKQELLNILEASGFIGLLL